MSEFEREEAGKPPNNPWLGIRITDAHGEYWIIDDRYIMMMDDLIGQLQRWLAYEE